MGRARVGAMGCRAIDGPRACARVRAGSAERYSFISAADVHLALALDYRGAPQRPELRQSDERAIESWHFLESRLRTDDHPAACRVVAGSVPGADEAAVLVDLAVREVRAQVPAASRDRVALTVDVQHGPVSDSPDRSRPKLINRSSELLCHLVSPSIVRRLVRRRMRSPAAPVRS